MTPDELRAYCLAKPGAWPDSPWEDHTVAKVADKIFAFLGDDGVGVKLGNGRAEADEWIREFPEDASVMAYIGRSGWNDLRINGAIPDEVVLEAVDTSYDLVVSRLPGPSGPPRTARLPRTLR